MTTCEHCERPIVWARGEGWVDPAATGDDIAWRETCDAHDTFTADHEPVDPADHVCQWGEVKVSRLAGTAHRECEVDGCRIINGYDDDELDDTYPEEDRGPWCNIHDRPHTEGGLACEAYSAECWAGTT